MSASNDEGGGDGVDVEKKACLDNFGGDFENGQYQGGFLEKGFGPGSVEGPSIFVNAISRPVDAEAVLLNEGVEARFEAQKNSSDAFYSLDQGDEISNLPSALASNRMVHVEGNYQVPGMERRGRSVVKYKTNKMEKLSLGRGRMSYHMLKQMVRAKMAKGGQNRRLREEEPGKTEKGKRKTRSGCSSESLQSISNELQSVRRLDDLKEFGTNIWLIWERNESKVKDGV
ncbi:hypothetical protein L6452_35404 [Arctium lappa]|uniref:Uncharacterized protein n=1 Tax=Arctium lappa TaxID=4217 RepID=A0ACB8Y719_ARCLA|nr:hypothetical protein L6452_35404 [Arctium lappa]